MGKTMLNQTVSRPILYAYAQEMIAKTPSKWLTGKNKKIEEETKSSLGDMIKAEIEENDDE